MHRSTVMLLASVLIALPHSSTQALTTQQVLVIAEKVLSLNDSAASAAYHVLRDAKVLTEDTTEGDVRRQVAFRVHNLNQEATTAAFKQLDSRAVFTPVHVRPADLAQGRVPTIATARQDLERIEVGLTAYAKAITEPGPHHRAGALWRNANEDIVTLLSTLKSLPPSDPGVREMLRKLRDFQTYLNSPK